MQGRSLGMATSRMVYASAEACGYRDVHRANQPKYHASEFHVEFDIATEFVPQAGLRIHLVGGY